MCSLNGRWKKYYAIRIEKEYFEQNYLLQNTRNDIRHKQAFPAFLSAIKVYSFLMVLKDALLYNEKEVITDGEIESMLSE